AISDGLFKGEWFDSNLDNIVKILKCFFLASGLEINIQKSQVLGVGVLRNIVNQAASLIGCGVMQNPFRYLGVMVGDNMSQKLAWADTVQKLLHVPKGVLKEMEAIRCNFFNGVDPAERKITWVSWDKVLVSKKNGGPGVSSFHALNHALLLKWVWRFLSQDGSLWLRICFHCKKRVGDGHNTQFWYDSWVFDQPLRVRFPRLFALETDKESTVTSKLGSSSVDASF
nr:RNA-directed DNA polymerase, eukaryota, reverse transcriptase zinc-binding domain protein [Tanacetum cinerariifolium]